jgi:hypothetical protein
MENFAEVHIHVARYLGFTQQLSVEGTSDIHRITRIPHSQKDIEDMQEEELKRYFEKMEEEVEIERKEIRRQMQKTRGA